MHVSVCCNFIELDVVAGCGDDDHGYGDGGRWWVALCRVEVTFRSPQGVTKGLHPTPYHHPSITQPR